MIYLSLDQSLNTTGYALFDDKTLIAYGKFNVPATKSIEQRLNLFIKEIMKLEEQYQFKDIFFEDIQYQNNAETYKKLAFVQAALIIWCYNTSHKFTILAPSHWRSILKNNYKVNFGRSRKEQKQKAQELVRQTYQVEVSEDEADAICLGTAALKEKEQNRSAF